MEIFKKENVLVVIAIAIIALWYYQKELNNNTFAKETINYLPVIGGLAFGLNTLVQLTK